MRSPATRSVVDLEGFLGPSGNARRSSEMAEGLVGSEILAIAADIRTRVAAGQRILNLTVGDFDPKHFPIPGQLLSGIVSALEQGETNYPPSSGMPALREAVRGFYERELGLRYPVGAVLVAGGARPLIHATYTTLCDPGDKVVYPVPSWNNNHYCHIVGAEGVAVPCGPETRFLPTPEAIASNLRGARLVSLNSPLNPTGTAISPEALRGICEAILEENRAREARSERPVYLMYDHIYWMLCMGGATHVTPPELVPEMARYTIFIDGLSKAFAATGVRVGWSVGPTDVMARMSAVLGHVGAWAPRAEQVASAALLSSPDVIRAYHATFLSGVQERLVALHEGFQAMRAAGLAVESIPPMGAIYLTVRIHPFGKRSGTSAIETNEDVRKLVLERAGVGIVPFQAFGAQGDDGWFRLSVGAVGLDEIGEGLDRLSRCLRSLE